MSWSPNISANSELAWLEDRRRVLRAVSSDIETNQVMSIDDSQWSGQARERFDERLSGLKQLMHSAESSLENAAAVVSSQIDRVQYVAAMSARNAGNG